LKVEEAHFGFDRNGNPCLTAKCRVGVYETSGKFNCGFGLARDRERLYLFAFRENPNNPIAAIKDREDAIKWLEKALEKNGYRWHYTYCSDVEEEVPSKMYVFMVPFTAEGWVELPDSVRESFQKMLDMLKAEGVS
jgi:hypothetical protein